MQEVAPFGGWVGSTINTITSPFYNHFAKYALYCFTAGSNVRDHRIETEALKLKKAGVDEMIEVNGHLLDAVPREQATLWLKSANSAVTKEEANRQRYGQRYRLCGCCSPNCLENYKISKRADEELKEVKSLISSAPGDTGVTRAPGPRRVESMFVEPAQIPPSRWIILRGSLHFIVSNDPNEGMVGMWGPDKDDNTNLLKHINNSFLEQSLFDFVIFVTCPSDCSVTNIQSEIIRRLCMNQDGDEATRATRIREQLQNKNFLVIVDDLRQKLDLAEVGIPHPLGFVEGKKRKVVIMSLSGYRSVCNLMGVNKDIELPILQEGEARELFRQSVNFQGDLYSHPHIGAHAADLVRAINGLPSELGRYGKAMCGITDASSWKVAIDAAARKFSRSASIESTLRLIEDDPALGVIGIWGPGGVGKTHLLKKIKDFFRGRMTVIWVTSSRECSVLKVQTQILEELKLTGDGNVETQSDKIRGFLENKSFLLLLDDLWERIDLESVGLPLPLGIEPLNKFKKKVVLTTRFTSVCGGMEVKKQIQVPYLQESEAWELFREKVGDQTLFSGGIEDRARILVTEMKGLPLALITVGRAMYGKFRPDQWDAAIQHMKKSCCIDTNEDPLKMEEEVFRKIMFSYDKLKGNRLKKCFLTCALWREDAEISMRELAECWLGLGLVEEQDMQSSYTTAYSLMGDLTGACLLEWCGKSNNHVKLHDVIRDMSLWISCGCGKNNGKWFVRAGVDSDEKFNIPWSTAEYISLMSNWTRKLPSAGDNLNVRVLCLQNNMLDETIIAGVLVNSAKLTYLDLSYNKLKEIPQSICDLAELIYLNLSGNVDLKGIPLSFGNLSKLKFLYLQYTGITIIPEEVISRLTELEIIHLGTRPIHGTSDIQSNVYRALGTLNHLKAVGTSAGLLDSRSTLREAADLPIWSLRLGESADARSTLRDTADLAIWSSRLGESADSRSTLREVADLTIWSLRLGESADARSILRDTADLAIWSSRFGESADSLSALREAVDLAIWSLRLGVSADARSTLRDTADLAIWSSRLGESADLEREFRLYDMLSFGFTRKTLYELDIANDRDVTDITLIQKPGEQPYSFGILSDLSIYKLPALTTVKWMGTSPTSVFPRLTSLIVSHCTKLEHLSWAMYLPRLEKLDVSFSLTMQRAFTRYHEDTKWSGQESSQTFPCLKFLRILLCESLETIGESDVTFPSLEVLQIHHCPELKRLPFQTPGSLPQKLRVLQMDARSWGRLELEEGVKSFLQPRLQYS